MHKTCFRIWGVYNTQNSRRKNSKPPHPFGFCRNSFYVKVQIMFSEIPSGQSAIFLRVKNQCIFRSRNLVVFASNFLYHKEGYSNAQNQFGKYKNQQRAPIYINISCPVPVHGVITKTCSRLAQQIVSCKFGETANSSTASGKPDAVPVG